MTRIYVGSRKWLTRSNNFAKMDLNATFVKAPISYRIVDKHRDFGLSFTIRTQTAKSRRC